MRIAVSACLLGTACRYDGRSKPHEGVMRALEQHEVLPICPEVAGGLPIPHPACEIVLERGESLEGDRDLAGSAGLRVVDAQGTDQTEAFLKGAQATLEAARQFGAELAILKAKSPSCGTGLIYDGSFTNQLREGWGVAAAMLRDAGISCADETQFDL